MRSVSRVCGVSINTVTKLLVDAGRMCATFHDEKVRNVAAKSIQCDEIWSFSYAKEKNVKAAKSPSEGAGHVWTWTAIDADSKLIVSWHVGDRSQYTGISFMGDLRARLANRVQLTTDGHKAYLKAVEAVILMPTMRCSSRYLPRVHAGPGSYSPPVCVGIQTQTIKGNADPNLIKTIAREERDAVERPDRVNCGDRFGNNRRVNVIQTASHAGRDANNG